MVMYVVTFVIIITTILNYFLGEKLYKEPKDINYFTNVEEYNLSKNKEIAAEPKYVVTVSIFTGILLGMYWGLDAISHSGGMLTFIATVIILCSYLMEITRRVALRDGKLVLTRFLARTKEIDAAKINGMYIYSYTRKFMKNHAYTVKLVVSENNGKKTKFTISSLDNRAVMNLMKESFGVQRNKMYIAKQGN